MSGSREDFGLAAPNTPTEAWGVVMDWPVSNGMATIVALSDGSASVYLSTGGGYIGGQGHERIKSAAQEMVAVASRLQPSMQAARGSFALPGEGETTFYVMTDSGVFTATLADSDLHGHQHPLTQLFERGQQVITEYRQLNSR